MPTCLPPSRNKASWVPLFGLAGDLQREEEQSALSCSTDHKEKKSRVPFLAPQTTRRLEILNRDNTQGAKAKETCRKSHQEMDKEQMKMAILKQEQIFRQQVHELHRLYHVQTQLMQQQMQTTASNRAPAIVDVKPKSQVYILHRERPTNPKQFISFSISEAPAPATEPAEDCSLELTLATGPSSSSGSGNAGTQQGKRLKTSSNSDSGTTAVSSTSTDSELAQFRDVKVAARFLGEGRRMDGMGQGAWMYQCLSLKTA